MVAETFMALQALVYTKKCIFPSRAANALQSINMVYAFAKQGVLTSMWPGIAEKNHQLVLNTIEHDFHLVASNKLQLKPLPGFHKGIYGLFFRLCLLRAWLLSPAHTVFYARDITEVLLLTRFKRMLPVKHPVFFEIHEILSEQHRLLHTGKTKYFAQLEKEIFHTIDGVICISPILLEPLENSYKYSGPALVAPMGYNPEIFKVAPEIDFSGPITLAYVGSLYESKGVHNLVRALDYLPQQFRLVVIGGNPNNELSNLQKLAQSVHNGATRVHFYGYVPPRKIFSYLKSCSMMVIPQKSEVEFFSPIKLYEAIGMGLPLVVTPIPALTSVLEQDKDAVIATGTDPQSLAAAILSMVSNEARAKQIQYRLRQRSRELTWDARAAKCLSFMTEISMNNKYST